MEEYHYDNMHVGIDKLYHKLAMEYFWPSMYLDCINYVRKCITCQLQQVRFRRGDDLKATFVGTRPR